MESALGEGWNAPDDTDTVGVVAVDIRVDRHQKPDVVEPPIEPAPVLTVEDPSPTAPTVDPEPAPLEPTPQLSMLETLEQLARPEPDPNTADSEDDDAAPLPWELLSSQLTPPPIPIEARVEHDWVGTSILDAGAPTD